VGVEISDDEGSLYFRIGPLDDGGAQGLLNEMEVPGLGQSLERLVDEVNVERDDSPVATAGAAEYLTLRIGKS
jgi:hypothetical protein